MTKNLTFLLRKSLFISVLILPLLCLSGLKSIGQLTAGDFAIIGFNGNANPANLAIVALKEIPSGTVLKITDKGWNQTAFVENTSAEGLITWTTNQIIPAGTVFNIGITSAATPVIAGLSTYGTTVATGWTTSINGGGGDNWFLYTGSDGSPNFIFGFANWSTSTPGSEAPDITTGWTASPGIVNSTTSYLPSILSTGNYYVTLTIATVFHGDFNNYTGTISGTKTSLLTSICTKTNWNITETPASKVSLEPGGPGFPGSNPIFQLGGAPSITAQPSNSTVCAGANSSFSVTAGNPVSYQWQYSTGGAYSNLSNTGVYSNTTAATMNITGATTDMNGYTYKCVVTGSQLPTATSNPASLTVNSSNVWLGTSNTLWSNAANWSCGTVPTASSNVIISGSAPNMPLVNVTNATCNDITIEANATLTISNGQILNIKGNATNNGHFSDGGKATFSGSNQTLPAGSYTNIEIAGTGIKTLGGATTISGILTLTASYLSLGNHNLTIGNNGGIAGGSASNYIITNGTGILRQQGIGATGRTGTVIFPVGNADSYTPVSITNAGTTDEFGARIITGAFATYDNNDAPTGAIQSSNAISRTWIVTEGVAGGSNATLRFQWNSSEELTGFNRSAAAASHYTNGYWKPAGISTVTGTGPYSISMSNVNSFSPFGVGSTNSVLPLTLLSFTGKQAANGVLLQWATAHEINTAGFDIQRAVNGTDFVTIGTVPPNTSLIYNHTDKNTARGSTYTYRLKMRDKDGASTYSSTLSITSTSTNTANSYSVYPNPVTDGYLYIKPLSNTGTPIQITIIDMTGRTWHQRAYTNANMSNGRFEIAIQQLPAGSYLLRISDNNGTTLQTAKFTTAD